MAAEHGKLQLLLTVTIVLAVVLGAHQQAWFVPIEQSLHDRLVQMRPDRPMDARLVVVGTTEADLLTLPMWPLSDDLLARTVARLQTARAAVIGIDLYRHTARPPGSADLARQLAAPNVVSIREIDGHPGPAIAYGANPPGDRIGFNDLTYDSDGVIRRALLMADNAQNEFLQAFSLIIAQQYLQQRQITARESTINPNWMQLGKATLIPLRPTSGPYQTLDAAGYQIWLDYRGRKEFVDVIPLQNLLAGQVTPDRLAGKIVLIGTLADSSRDLFFTPYSSTERDRAKMPGVMIHAQMISQLLDLAQGQRRLPWFWPDWAEVWWIGGWTIAGSLVAHGIPKIGRSSLTIGAVAASIGTIGGALFGLNGWIPIAPPILGSVLAWAAVFAMRGQEARQQRQIAIKLLGLNASPAVAKALWRDRHQLIESGRLPGQQLAATILFTDIRNFSTIAERLPPEGLLEWLNEYLDMLTHEVLARDGVVNKFTGDGILALFGVPTRRTRPQDIAIDAAKAIDCALAMREQLVRLNRSWHSRRLPVIQMRVGIYTGEVVVGSLGGRDRLEYGVLGDSVNVASRLESCVKERQPDDCRILVGEATLEAMGDRITALILEPWGSMALKGRNQRVKVYHVNGRYPPAAIDDRD